jgi:hypothetical protein
MKTTQARKAAWQAAEPRLTEDKNKMLGSVKEADRAHLSARLDARRGRHVGERDSPRCDTSHKTLLSSYPVETWMHIDSVPVYLIQCELPLIDRSTKGAVST